MFSKIINLRPSFSAIYNNLLPFIRKSIQWAGFDLVASDEIPIAVADTTPPVIISGLFWFKIIFKSTFLSNHAKNETVKFLVRILN